MPFDRILVGTDLSEGAAVAARLAQRLGHPRTRYEVALALAEAWPRLSDEVREEFARSALESTRAWADGVGLGTAEVAAPFGAPSKTLARLAREFRADLVAVGHRGRSAIATRLLGSTARSLLRTNEGDTLIARRDAPIRSIMVATDFHAPGDAAAARARQVAKATHAKVSAVHVIDPSVFYDPGLETPETPTSEWIESAVRRKLVEFNLQHLGGEAEEHLLRGRPAQTIAQRGREAHVDLIVIGSHGAGVLERALIGSTAESIVELATCNVLVVRG